MVVHVGYVKRILVIGTSGSGKSTFAQKLSKRLQIPFFASDPFYWEADWQIASDEKVRECIRAVIQQEAWILDGNFDSEHEWVWKQANCILWLDYPLVIVCRQIIFRNLRWVVTRERTWSGNRMTFGRAISGIRHAIRSHSLKRRKYPQWLAELSGVEVHRFKSRREADFWIQCLNNEHWSNN